MRYFISVFIFINYYSVFGQTKFSFKVTINGKSDFNNAFLYFPIPVDTTNSSMLDLPIALKCDTINVYGKSSCYLDKLNNRQKAFYCIWQDKKSRIYFMTENDTSIKHINFLIPENSYYDSLYKTKTCPLCHRKESVIPLIYGKVGKQIIALAQKGELKLAGCSKSNTSPEFYCKTDLIEF